MISNHWVSPPGTEYPPVVLADMHVTKISIHLIRALLVSRLRQDGYQLKVTLDEGGLTCESALATMRLVIPGSDFDGIMYSLLAQALDFIRRGNSVLDNCL